MKLSILWDACITEHLSQTTFRPNSFSEYKHEHYWNESIDCLCRSEVCGACWEQRCWEPSLVCYLWVAIHIEGSKFQYVVLWCCRCCFVFLFFFQSMYYGGHWIQIAFGMVDLYPGSSLLLFFRMLSLRSNYMLVRDTLLEVGLYEQHVDWCALRSISHNVWMPCFVALSFNMWINTRVLRVAISENMTRATMYDSHRASDSAFSAWTWVLRQRVEKSQKVCRHPRWLATAVVHFYISQLCRFLYVCFVFVGCVRGVCISSFQQI